MLPKASLLETRRPRGGVGEARGLALAVGVGHKAVGLIPGQALGAALGVNDFHGAAPGRHGGSAWCGPAGRWPAQGGCGHRITAAIRGPGLCEVWRPGLAGRCGLWWHLCRLLNELFLVL